MFKHFRVILRITPRDIGNFFKAAGRFIKSILPAFLISFSILTAFSMPVLASTSGGFVVDKNPTTPVYNGDYTKYYNRGEALKEFEYGDHMFLHLYDYLNYYSVFYSVPDLDSASPSVVELMRALGLRFQCSGSFPLSLVVNPLPLSGLRLVSYDHSSDTLQNAELANLFVNLKPVKTEGSYVCYLKDRIYYFLLEDGDIFMVTPECIGGFATSGDFIISGTSFNEAVENNNTLFFPKNFNGKVSYRNDLVWHNKYDSTSTAYNTMEFYTAESGFPVVGGGDEIYLIFFEKLSDTTYYHKYQFHFTVKKEEVWYTDRDEIEYTNYRFDIEYWDMVDGSEDDEPTKLSYYDTNGKYNLPYFRIYFSSASSASYKGIKIKGYASYSEYLNYGSFVYSSNAFFNQFVCYNADLLSSITMSNAHFTGALSTHDACAYNGDCDFGYIASLTPISTTYKVDTSKIPDNYYITINGDTIYDYSITNPETGAKDTINNYITNNYTLPEPSTSQPSTGTGTGGGNVNVDVDVNVNIGGNGNHYDMPDTSFFDSYLDDALEESTGIRKFIGDFFNTLPGQITQLIGLSIVIAILCRLIGR